VQKNKLNKVYSWLLLICFLAGQYIVYTHQHKAVNGIVKTVILKHQHPQQTVQEKCNLCDAMHHTHAVINNALSVTHQLAVPHVYKAHEYGFISFSLVLASGRAPPVVS